MVVVLWGDAKRSKLIKEPGCDCLYKRKQTNAVINVPQPKQTLQAQYSTVTLIITTAIILNKANIQAEQIKAKYKKITAENTWQQLTKQLKSV